MNRILIAGATLLACSVAPLASADLPADVSRELEELGALAPEALLERVRKSGACVRVLESGRPAPARSFAWGKAEAPQGRLEEASSQKNLMGKMLCKGERPLAKDCPTIVLASDAPRGTLLHEFLHFRQMEKDASWCPLSARLWERAPTDEESRRIRDKEWEVHRLLWRLRDKLGFALDDELTVAAETVEEAEARKGFDPSAAAWVEEEKLRSRLAELMARYQADLAKAQVRKSLDGVATTSHGIKKRWKTLPVRLCIHQGVPARHRPALREAASAWNRGFGKPVFDLSCSDGSPEERIGKPGDLAARWIVKDFNRYGDKTVVARTLTEAVDDTGEFVGASVLFNAESFDWTSRNLDLRTVALHELGHVLGLDHNPLWPDSVMGNHAYASGVKLRKLGAYEKTAVAGVYFGGKARLPAYLDAYLNDDVKGALRELEKPGARAPREEYALALLRKGARRHREAIPMLERLLRGPGAPARARYELGEAYWSDGREADAEKAFRAVLALNPNDYEALANLGSLTLNRGKTQEAKAFFEKALSLNPVHYVACYFLFQMTQERGYKECVIKYSNDPELIRDGAS